jgi:hypothetical protein
MEFDGNEFSRLQEAIGIDAFKNSNKEILKILLLNSSKESTKKSCQDIII